MQYTLLRFDDTTDRDGNPEAFAQVQFSDDSRTYPYAKWLDPAEYAAYAADHAALPGIILSWADEAKRVFYDASVITPRQARLTLLQVGLMEAVEAFVATLPKAAQVEWEYANEIRRDHVLLTQVATALDLTEAQIDDLFSLAATL